jgi:hypothetical protein
VVDGAAIPDSCRSTTIAELIGLGSAQRYRKQAWDARQSRDRRAAAGGKAHDDAGDSDALLAGKKPEATRHQAMLLQAAIFAMLRKGNGGLLSVTVAR